MVAMVIGAERITVRAFRQRAKALIRKLSEDMP